MRLFPKSGRLACLALILVCVSLSAAVIASAQKKPDAAKTDPADGRDPAAIALRDRVVKAYHELRGIHERITQRQWKSSPEDALTLDIEFRFRKPNLLYLAVDYPFVEKPGRWQLVYACNGKHLTLFNSARNEYQTIKAPSRLDKLVLPQSLRSPEFQILLRDAPPFEELEKGAIVRYSEIYESAVEGTWRILKIDMQQDGAKRTLRYRVDPKDSLIRGISLSILPDPDAVSPFADPEPKSTLEANYTLVEANPRFTDSDFNFVPPADAKEQKQEEKEEKPETVKPSGRRRPSSPGSGR